MAEETIPPTPQKETEFNPKWVNAVMRRYFEVDLGVDPEAVEVTEVNAAKNEVQGILSITYVVNFKFKVADSEEYAEGNRRVTKQYHLDAKYMMFHFTEESRSIFVKVPLQGEPMYHSVNARELTMLKVVSIEHFERKMHSS